ncbi:hypothetical protein FDK21_20000 [Cohaesibacter sp. CAU 1516]|uniref:hypothetical protein n=1 Tax=Cohaesibacter sp. CAU 1516 TaxID=2576038 RepID=UPI0010FD4A31|nr:hypothetical protein [Cohaesibacter sp. CAU 1516]TLP42300.1 hypothetical protein FDK21_20000 [Cohaesibacter sp. CAU 1516]
MKKLSNKLILSGLIIAGISATLLGAPIAMSAQVEIPAGAGISSWVENGSGGIYTLQILEGTLPEAGRSVTAKVLSDSNCAPDEEGINHCENEIKMPDGSKLKGIDHHRMSVNRCLRAGEKVTISMLTDGWATVLTKEAK